MMISRAFRTRLIPLVRFNGGTPEPPKSEEAEPEPSGDSQANLDLLKKLEDSDKEISKYKDLYMRAIAEQHNITKRLNQEIENERVYSITKFAKELLDVSDNLQRALQNSPAPESLTDLQSSTKSYTDLLNGVSMTRDLLMKSFGKFGIEEFNPLGEKFDANLHEALFTFPKPEAESGTVGEVMSTGFKIKDRVLRSPKVGVIKNTSK